MINIIILYLEVFIKLKIIIMTKIISYICKLSILHILLYYLLIGCNTVGLKNKMNKSSEECPICESNLLELNHPDLAYGKNSSVYCDHCGNNIKNNILHCSSGRSFHKNGFDLCTQCMSQLNNNINKEDKSFVCNFFNNLYDLKLTKTPTFILFDKIIKKHHKKCIKCLQFFYKVNYCPKNAKCLGCDKVINDSDEIFSHTCIKQKETFFYCKKCYHSPSVYFKDKLSYEILDTYDKLLALTRKCHNCKKFIKEKKFWGSGVNKIFFCNNCLFDGNFNDLVNARKSYINNGLNDRNNKIEHLFKNLNYINTDTSNMPTFTNIDNQLGIYYKYLCKDDYFDDEGKGKFLQFVEEQECNDDDGDIKDELEDGNEDDCQYCDFDEDFPLLPGTNETERNYLICDILRYIYKFNTINGYQSINFFSKSILNEDIEKYISSSLLVSGYTNEDIEKYISSSLLVSGYTKKLPYDLILLIANFYGGTLLSDIPKEVSGSNSFDSYIKGFKQNCSLSNSANNFAIVKNIDSYIKSFSCELAGMNFMVKNYLNILNNSKDLILNQVWNFMLKTTSNEIDPDSKIHIKCTRSFIQGTRGIFKNILKAFLVYINPYNNNNYNSNQNSDNTKYLTSNFLYKEQVDLFLEKIKGLIYCKSIINCYINKKYPLKSLENFIFMNTIEYYPDSFLKNNIEPDSGIYKFFKSFFLYSLRLSIFKECYELINKSKIDLEEAKILTNKGITKILDNLKNAVDNDNTFNIKKAKKNAVPYLKIFGIKFQDEGNGLICRHFNLKCNVQDFMNNIYRTRPDLVEKVREYLLYHSENATKIKFDCFLK